MDTIAQTAPRAGRREFIGLAVLCLPTILVALDMSVLYLALPHLGGDLGASSIQQLWITDVYGFMLAGLLVTMGTLGDRIGRKRLLLIGGTCFAIASVLTAYSTSPEMLIATRALLGIAGSSIMPSTMALISVMFQDRKQNAMAIGVWMGCFMGGTALGPVVGGVLLEFFWWGSVFLLGVPVMALLLIFGPKVLPEFRNPKAGRLDLPSVALSMLGILPLVFGLKQLSRDGVGALPIIGIVVGLASGYLFFRRQRRLTSPLLDLTMFRNRTFSTALFMTLVAGLTGSNQLFVSFYMQSAQELSPVATALWMLPSTIVMVIVIQLATVLIRYVRPAYVIGGGLVVAAIGYLMLTQLTAAGNLVLLVAGLVVAYLGIGPMAGLCATLGMQSAPQEKAGSAAALTSTSGEFGIAMGIATVGIAGTALYRGQVEIGSNVPPEAAEAAKESIAGAMAVADQLPPQESSNLLDSAFQAVTTSLHGSAAICAGLALVAAVIVMIGLRHTPKSGGDAPPAEQVADPADTTDSTDSTDSTAVKTH
ncbi:MFS transporter [Amycolatopsis nigrescens]|uniref:MFS transporter n=1 Tax=Amycolatopsis nigrescens TaxID=381445 RepID=UPI000687EFD8|nr:MFS transporter [Amycolatopsis nigrescens]